MTEDVSNVLVEGISDVVSGDNGVDDVIDDVIVLESSSEDVRTTDVVSGVIDDDISGDDVGRMDDDSIEL